jgi:1,4-alpha-glucan branching enzyme
MYDTELFGHWWWEGPEFLAQLVRKLHRDGEVECVSGGDLLDRGPEARTMRLPEGSWGESGHHSVWLNGENRWMWERLYPAERRMRHLAQTVQEGGRRFATQAARELLLAEASDWPFLITAGTARDYAEDRFWGHMQRFDRFAAIAERLRGAERASAEEEAFLREWEARDAPFGDLDIEIWR